MKKFDFKAQKTDTLSRRMLLLLLGLTVVVFALFYLVGYDVPYIFDPDYNAPVLTDVLLLFIYFMTALAVGVLCVSVVRGYKRRARQTVENGIPVARIAWATAGGLLLVLLLTFCFGSTEAVSVNGQMFTDAFWLRLTDMFINTSLLLILVCAVAVAVSLMRRRQK